MIQDSIDSLPGSIMILNRKLSALIISAVIILFTTTRCGKKSDIYHVAIGTGGVTGVYYPAGGAIARMVNKKTDRYKIRVTVESTSGSVYNINAVLSGDINFGIAQSDRLFQACRGFAEWEKAGPQRNIRSVFGLHHESITMVASEKSGIKKFYDIRGKIINLGNPGSGQLQNARDAMEAFGINESEIRAEYIKAVEAAGLLQDERIDAFFYTVGHPNGSLKEAAAGRVKVRIVDLSGKPLNALFKKYPFYTASVIPAEMYPGILNTEDIATFGVRALLICSAGTRTDAVYALVKEVFDNFDEFKKLHPAYAVLTREDMLKGMTAPFHEGAMKYYRETGLDRYIN